MKHYNLLICLLPFLIVTAQASQQPNLDLNNNNTNEKSEYIHGDITNWQEWIKDVKYKDLKLHLVKLYRDGIARPTEHIKTTLPVYFVVGPTRSGKSTFIFALQGNQIDKKKQSRGRKRNRKENVNSVQKITNSDTRYNNTGQLTLVPDVNVPTPEVADSSYGVTKGIKVYYTGKEIKRSMAFCDTEGFLGEREDELSKAEKIVSTYAPYFALKANHIGGIVFFVAASDIDSTGGKNFITCMSFLKTYFDLAMVNENKKELKQSVTLLINKADNQEDNAFRNLARLIKDSYKAYYQDRMKQNKNNNYNANQKPNNKKEQLNQLKPFFSLFLKNDIDEDTIKNRIDKYTNDLKKLDKIQDKQIIKQHEEDIINFFDKLIDEDKVCCFYPDDKDEVEKTRQVLNQLRPIAPKYLSLEDNPLSQYLIKQIMDISYDINNTTHKTLKCINLTQLQRLLLQQNNSKKLAKLSSKLKQRKKQFEQQNETIFHNKMLKCIFEERHIQDVPFEKRKKEINKLKNEVIVGGLGGLVGGLVGLGLGGLVGVVEGVLGVVGGLVGGGLGVVVGGGVGLGLGGVVEGVVVGGGVVVVEGVCYYRAGYLRKDFAYTGEALIYRIVIKEKNKGSITWKKPSKDFITKHFTKQLEDTTITLTSKDDKGVKQDKWHLVHWSAYEKNADCDVKFFSKKNHLQASQWQIEDNKSKIDRIDNLLKEEENSKFMNKQNLAKEHEINQKEANKEIKELCEFQDEMKMINCWANRIFKKDSANQELIEQYRHNYNEAVPDKYQISIQDETNITSSYQDNTNTKHSDYQPGLTNNQRMEGEEECKEDDENNNNNNSLSNLKISVPLTVTAILAGLLSQQN